MSYVIDGMPISDQFTGSFATLHRSIHGAVPRALHRGYSAGLRQQGLGSGQHHHPFGIRRGRRSFRDARARSRTVRYRLGDPAAGRGRGKGGLLRLGVRGEEQPLPRQPLPRQSPQRRQRRARLPAAGLPRHPQGQSSAEPAGGALILPVGQLEVPAPQRPATEAPPARRGGFAGLGPPHLSLDHLRFHHLLPSRGGPTLSQRGRHPGDGLAGPAPVDLLHLQPLQTSCAAGIIGKSASTTSISRSARTSSSGSPTPASTIPGRRTSTPTWFLSTSPEGGIGSGFPTRVPASYRPSFCRTASSWAGSSSTWAGATTATVS